MSKTVAPTTMRLSPMSGYADVVAAVARFRGVAGARLRGAGPPEPCGGRELEEPSQLGRCQGAGLQETLRSRATAAAASATTASNDAEVADEKLQRSCRR
eukprot:9406809-Alexandrium_andersonii.AAC.1